MNFVEGSGKLGLMAALLLALSVSGCGRKGGLDLPPQAAAQPAGAQQAAEPAQRTGPTGLFEQDDDDRPAAVRGQKRRIILDPLLD